MTLVFFHIACTNIPWEILQCNWMCLNSYRYSDNNLLTLRGPFLQNIIFKMQKNCLLNKIFLHINKCIAFLFFNLDKMNMNKWVCQNSMLRFINNMYFRKIRWLTEYQFTNIDTWLQKLNWNNFARSLFIRFRCWHVSEWCKIDSRKTSVIFRMIKQFYFVAHGWIMKSRGLRIFTLIQM